MRLTVLASGSKGNSAVVASDRTRVLVDAGLSCRELLRRMAQAGEDPEKLSAILITHEHQDHVAGLGVLARRLGIPVYLTEPTHRAWVRMLTPRTTMTYARWLEQYHEKKTVAAVVASTEQLEATIAVAAEAAALDIPEQRSDDPNAGPELPVDPEDDCDTSARNARESREKLDPASLPAVEYFTAGRTFAIGDLEISPFTIPHDAADPCGFVIRSLGDGIRMALATDLGYMPSNVKAAIRDVDVLLLESNHDLEMLRDGPYPWSVKQRVLSRVGHLSNDAAAEFLERDYDGGAHTVVLAHLSESNNVPELARISAERALGDRMRLLGNRVVIAPQAEPMEAICL